MVLLSFNMQRNISLFSGGDVQNYLFKKDFIPYRYLALLFEAPDSYLGKMVCNLLL